MLTKTHLEDDLARRLKGLDGGALAVFTRMPPMAESDFIPATATFTAPRAGIWTKADDGGSLGSSPSWWGKSAGVRQPVVYHLGCPLEILHPPT